MDPILLLHGALGTKAQFDVLAPHLESHFDLHRFSFEGHGDAGSAGRPFRIEYFAENVLAYLEEQGIEKINIFGYSMGGYVALALAKEYPEYVNKIATLGTILQWDEGVAKRECRYLHPEKIKQKVPHFAKKLDARHPNRWEQIVDRTREMLQHLGANPIVKTSDWSALKPPIRFHIGDQDTTAGLDSTVQIYRKMDNSDLCVLPATAHPIEEVKERMIVTSITDFYLH